MHISDRIQRIVQLVSYILNAFFILFGLLVIGLGIYFFIYKGDLLGDVFERAYIRVSVIIIIVCGCTILAFAFVGLCGTFVLNRFILTVYAVTLFLLGLLSIAAIVMAIIYKNTWYIDEVRQQMRNKIQKYYGLTNTSDAGVDTQEITRTWDTIQGMWYCCGVEDDSWGIYRQSQWYNNQPGDPGTKEYTAKMVPLSCCLKSQYGVYVNTMKCQNWQLGPPNVQSSNFNEALLYRGCFVYGRQLLNMVGSGVIGLGVVITILCFVAAGLKLILLISLRDDAPPPSTVHHAHRPNFTPMPTYPDPNTYPSASYSLDKGSGQQRDYAYDNPHISSSNA